MTATMRSFKEMRQDPHCPRNMDPADYVMVGEFDAGSGYKWVRHNVLRRFGIATGNVDQYSFAGVPFFDPATDADPPRPNYRCHHCGKHGSNIRYFVLFLHKPSSQVIVVGQICAKKLKLESKDELDRLQSRRDEFERRQVEERWSQDHAEEIAYLREYDIQHSHESGWYSEFFESLWAKFLRDGSLTDGQVSGLRKWMAKGKPWVRETPKPTIDADRHKGEVTHAGEPITDAQESYINNLCADLGMEVPSLSMLTRIEASQMINDLKARKIAQSEAEQEANAPAWTKEPMSDKQRTLINRLMEERVMPPEARIEARQRLDAGLTKGQASKWIDRLQKLPAGSED